MCIRDRSRTPSGQHEYLLRSGMGCDVTSISWHQHIRGHGQHTRGHGRTWHGMAFGVGRYRERDTELFEQRWYQHTRM
eukprot:2912427-Rhodomonas_salina.1